MARIRSLRTLAVLTAGNLRAARSQAAYLVLTLAITTAVWLILAAMGSPYVRASNIPGITIRNGSQRGSLPLGYAPRIEAIRGALDVFWYGIQAVKCTAATMVQLNAFGGPGTDTQLARHKVPAATIQRYNTDPLAAVISEAAAAKCGWRVGQGVEPPMAVFDSAGNTTNGKPIALHIIGIFPGEFPQANVHYGYINRTAPGIQGKNKVVTYFANAGDPRDNELLAARVEAAFAHDFPALNATTNATVQNAWSRYGKVQQLLAFVMVAILLCAASVLVSVLAHAAAQRKSKFALLQVLGFRRTTLLGAFMLELLAILSMGALLGVGLETLVAQMFGSSFFGFLGNGAPAWAWWGLPAWLASLGIAALAWPAALIARVRPADFRAV
ncbi:MAG: ABC transporter permease [Xanthomonadaceae bacterium]|nr:ABC transporter permease [Xanthomonadaceae bacterium]